MKIANIILSPIHFFPYQNSFSPYPQQSLVSLTHEPQLLINSLVLLSSSTIPHLFLFLHRPSY